MLRDEQCANELTRDSAGRRHRDEVKKSIQAEDQKDQAQKEPTDIN